MIKRLSESRRPAISCQSLRSVKTEWAYQIEKGFESELLKVRHHEKGMDPLFITVFLILGTTQGSFSKEPVRLYFFYSEESGGLKVQEGFITPLSKKYPLEIQSFSLNKLDNYDLLGNSKKN